MEKNNRLLWTFGAGLAVGGLLGVLFAPDKGSETRKKLKISGNKLSENMRDKFARSKEALQNLREHYAEKIDVSDDR